MIYFFFFFFFLDPSLTIVIVSNLFLLFFFFFYSSVVFFIFFSFCFGGLKTYVYIKMQHLKSECHNPCNINCHNFPLYQMFALPEVSNLFNLTQ